MDTVLPFPLLALVGQTELKIALILTLINPQIGGILLSGPYGVGKTTAVRGLLDIMPSIEREDLEGNPCAIRSRMRLIELPLNARMEDVVGGVNERVALEQNQVILEEGVLAKAHRNVLYIDEVNLLDARLIDVILDAAAQGRTLVRRGPMTRLFPAQFVLIGSMNPEEGSLRPQIMDRFGLRAWIPPLDSVHQRLEIYRRAQAFRENPHGFRMIYAEETAALAEEVEAAREILPYVTVPPNVEAAALHIIQELKIPSHRAEIALLEAVRARAAADFRNQATLEDVQHLAPLALRQRCSDLLDTYTTKIQHENTMIDNALNRVLSLNTTETKLHPIPADTLTDRAESSPKKQRRTTVRKLSSTEDTTGTLT